MYSEIDTKDFSKTLKNFRKNLSTLAMQSNGYPIHLWKRYIMPKPSGNNIWTREQCDKHQREINEYYRKFQKQSLPKLYKAYEELSNYHDEIAGILKEIDSRMKNMQQNIKNQRAQVEGYWFENCKQYDRQDLEDFVKSLH